MLKCDQLICYRNNRPLFDPVTFSVDQGVCLQIVGENGAGKTTLLRTLSGILPLQRGRILWEGFPIDRDPALFQKALFYLGHQLALKEALSVLENLQLDLSCALYEKHVLEAALEEWGMRDLSTAFVHQLSRGQRQRLALVKFFLSNARLYILDEPLSGLDQDVVGKVQDHIQKKLNSGASVILTSHQTLTLPGASLNTLKLKSVGS